MILQDAYDAAQSHLDQSVRPDQKDEVVINSCVDREDAWWFGFHSRPHVGEIAGSSAVKGFVVVPMDGSAPRAVDW